MRLTHHLETCHTKDVHYVASGTKQAKVVLALHSSDQFSESTVGWGLRRNLCSDTLVCPRNAFGSCIGSRAATQSAQPCYDTADSNDGADWSVKVRA